MSQHAASKEPEPPSPPANKIPEATRSEPETAQPVLRAFLLGGFTLERADGDSIDVFTSIARSQSILLLKLLLCHPHRQVTRERLTEIIWPGQSCSTMDGSLSVAKSLLKTGLEALCGQALLPRVHGDPPSYRLAGQRLLWTDVDACESAVRRAVATAQAREALVQWEAAYDLLQRGALLAEDQTAYWYQARLVQDRRKKLAKQRSQCVLRIADLALECGDSKRAIAVLTNEHEAYPSHEEIAFHLMGLLAQVGRNAEALQCYARLEVALLEQNAEPRQETKVLAQHLRSEGTARASVNRHVLLQQEEMWRSVSESVDNLPTQNIADDLRTEQMTRERFLVVRDSPFGNAPLDYHEMSLLQAASPFQFASPRIWNVPYQRNPFFTGREDVLTRLHEILNREKAVGALAQHALCGLGGIGKTQTVLEYIYRYESEYQAVFWIKADTRENLFADFLSLAQLLALPERDAQDQTVATAAIQRWLQEHVGWLLVFDNADDLEMVREVLPTGCQGHVLLTTRAQAMGRVAHRLEVEEMSLETGALFLLRRAGLIEPDAPLEKASEKDQGLAEGLVQELGGLPLALDQAGAYIEETASSLQEYLALYHTHRLALLQRRGGLNTDHPESVATTWALAFTHIENSDPVAVDLLRLCAFLDPDAIPEEIITTGAFHLGPALRSVATDAFALGKAIEALRKFSLVRRNPETHMLTIHRLVQASIQDAMNQVMQRVWIERTIQAVNATFPGEVTVALWQHCQRLLPHLQMCVTLVEQYNLCLLEAATLFNQAAYYLRERVIYSEAESLYQRALIIREQILGSRHPDTAQVLYNLARLYFELGQYVECEGFYLRALVIREELLPPDHLDIALSLNSLAFMYYKWGIKYGEAEKLFQRALFIFDRAIGMDHPKTAHCLSNLALLYATQGKFVEAEQLLLRVQAIRDKFLGHLHLDTARSLQNLAWLYIDQRKQERFEEAKRLLEDSLEIRETLLGPEHTQTANSLYHLATLHEAWKQDNEAEQLYQRVLTIRRKMMGRDNPKVLLTEGHYAALLKKMERYEEAAQLERHIQMVQGQT